MQIIAHRGVWSTPQEKNTLTALKKALVNGWGFESDVRDYIGEMVISHNIADTSSPKAAEVFKMLHEFNDEYCFAINIKADGLKDILKEYFLKYNITNYFLFDMSVPQMVEFREMGLRYFTRQSEVEPEPCMYEDAAGVWIDGFWSTEWITEALVEKHLQAGKEVCLVSPDLHGKEYKSFWKMLKNWKLSKGKIFICTDYPDEAKEYFNEKD